LLQVANHPEIDLSNAASARSANLRYGFRVSGLQLVPAESVLTEMVIDAKVFPLPKAAAAMAGVMNLRGTIVPLLDANATEKRSSDIRPSQCRALVFDRDERRIGLIVNSDPVMVALVEAATESIRPASPMEPFFIRPWAQEDQPSQIWWEFDHRAAFAYLARTTVSNLRHQMK
jgi:chemotaxis signal transduction protein